MFRSHLTRNPNRHEPEPRNPKQAEIDVEAIKAKFGITAEAMTLAQAQLAPAKIANAQKDQGSLSRTPSGAPNFKRTLSRSGSVYANTYV